jgi:protein involved in polysaccharide export with SLBB domain
VLCTGTGIIVTEDVKLEPGDVVRIRVDEIGELANRAAVV